MLPAALAAFLLCPLGIAQDPTSGTGKTKPVATASNPWVAETSRQREFAADAAEIVEVFEFANPTDQAVEFRQLEGSCSCSRVEILVGTTRYELLAKPWTVVRLDTTPDGETRTTVPSIPVAPHERGAFSLHVTLEGSVKQKSVSLTVHTSDPATPMMQLSLALQGQRDFAIDHEELDLGVLEPEATREFTVTVRSPTQKTFEVRPVGETPKGFAIRWERTEVDGEPVWTMHGTLTAGAKPTPPGTMREFAGLAASLSLPGDPQFTVRVGYRVAPPIEVTPGFLSMGPIKKGVESTHALRLVRNDGKKVVVTGVAIEGPQATKDAVRTAVVEVGDGSDVKLTVVGTAPTGLLRGEVVIQFDHPTCKELRIAFNGFVR